jgi:hypothetical protein
MREREMARMRERDSERGLEWERTRIKEREEGGK